jgi:hypothetical protein
MPETVKIFPISKGNFRLPAHHRPGMEVPKGGSSCSNCLYFEGMDRDEGELVCSEPNFIRFHGSRFIPAPDGDPKRFCSDFWEWDRPEVSAQ